jgi:hypothetical protein
MKPLLLMNSSLEAILKTKTHCSYFRQTSAIGLTPPTTKSARRMSRSIGKFGKTLKESITKG